MLELDLTGPLAFSSGFEPNWFDEAAKTFTFSPYCLLSRVFGFEKYLYLLFLKNQAATHKYTHECLI